MVDKEVYINGLKVNYKIAGSGQPILILHGWGGSSNSWVHVQEILSRQGYRVIVPDLPGFGQSKTPLQPWDVTDYNRWVAEFIDSQNLDEFFLISHSFGGRVAIKFAIQYPEKIKSLILCSSAGIKPKPGFKTIIIFWLARIGNAIFTSKILARFKDGARNLFYVFLRHKDYVKANGTMRETIKKVLDEDLLNDLSKIKVKTLLIWGGKDKLVPLKYAQIFEEKIENSKLEVLPKIGHSPHLEVPGKLSEIILKFIKE